jgi:hypothetical protein
MPSARRRCIALGNVYILALVLPFPRIALSQHGPDVAMPGPGSQPLVAVWVSGGVGSGGVQVQNGGSSVAGVARASASVGPWLLTYRSSDVGPFMTAGTGVRDAGILAGVRTSGHRAFASAALGYARANPYHSNDPSEPSVGVMAYDVAVHANAYVPGIALAFSGDVGPSRATYVAVTLSAELGWFGR